MYNKEMYALGSDRSVIRELFEYGKTLGAEIGFDKVFDFTLGNPSVPTPNEINDTIKHLIDNDPSVHAYTSAPGNLSTRKAISDYIASAFGALVPPDLIYMTAGAAAALTVTMRSIISSPNDEILAIAPFFPEYRVFAEGMGAKFSFVPLDEKNFMVDTETLSRMITPNTRAVIINSPNNPSGTVYDEQTIQRLTDILKEKEKEYSHQIILIADEPYREITFDGVKVPYIINYYNDTVVCYSFSKSLSLPGERIGYIAVSPKLTGARDFYLAVCGSGRALGFVCAPSLFQKVVENCIGQFTPTSVYKDNRDILIKELTALGLRCCNPQGAFYILAEAPEKKSEEFCEKAKKYGILIVPTDTFGAPGYVRIATCVPTDMIIRSLPYFTKLMGK